MVTVPARLMELESVEVHQESEDIIVLSKRLKHSVYERSSYASMHVLSVVTAGRQRIRTEAGDFVTASPGRPVLLRRGLYTVSDLIVEGESTFNACLIYFSGRGLGVASPGTKQDVVPLSQPLVLPDLASPQAVKNYLRELAPVQLILGAPTRREPLPFLRQHYDKPFTLEDFAYLTGSSVSTFQRVFRTHTGTSPRRWIVARRLERARELVGDGKLSVADISFAVGYRNTSHFIRAYREKFGSTPGNEMTE